MSNPQYDNTNTFSLFLNDRKREGKKDPDRTGTLNVDGIEYFLDAWIHKTQDGSQFLSGKIKRKDKQPATNAAAQSDEF